MSRRTDQVASVLQHEVGNFILTLELPALTTISKVEVTPDLKWCKVWITIMGDETQKKEVLKMLLESRRELQDILLHKMTMKFIPRIKYVIDTAEEYAAHINELLRKTHEQ
jgi:ribosome-binding factor A